MSKRLEDEVKDIFNKKFPFSLLSNIILYRNDRDVMDSFANEIDYLFHYQSNGVDHLIIVEVKQREIYGNIITELPTSTSKWKLDYDEKAKDIKKQVIDQGTALKQFCKNITNSEEPEIQYWIVDMRERVVNVITDKTNNNLKLLTLEGFKEKISMLDCVIKVEHSIFLREIRKGVVSPELGHPELRNAIQFIKICRQSLDDQIYRFFQPRKQFYALNGCAGMGKSVLLAYSLFVFTTDYAVYFNDGKTKLEPFRDPEMFPAKDKRWIFVYAVKKKQIDILQSYYDSIFKYTSRMVNTQLQPLQPIFKQWKGKIDKKCNILIIDEAHDLSIQDQRLIADWINIGNSKSQDKYLLIACDRNQAPKRGDKDENIIEGINFSRHSTRLNRIYRCPFPVYVASMGLLFRWFARKGAGVLLSSQKLREHFGFNSKVERNSERMALTMRNDCHPGNNWEQTVDIVDDCSTIYAHLSQSNFEREEILWACFEKMEPEFDYDEIHRKYTYVDLRNEDADNEIDKNIKGQEFAIVVVEGLPKNMNPPELISRNDWGRSASKLEQIMWDCRKNIYITCSRASAFLYFIINKKISSKENTDELTNLIEQVTNPVRKKHSSGQEWKFKVNIPYPSRKPDIFKDIENNIYEPVIQQRVNVDKEEKIKPVSDLKQDKTKNIEICRNKKSGAYFICLKEVSFSNNGKIELISYPGAIKNIFERHLFHEIESRNINELLSENLITQKQVDVYKYYRNRNGHQEKKRASTKTFSSDFQNNRVYEYRIRNAVAKMVVKNGSYIILKGSTAVNGTQVSIPDNCLRIRKELIQSRAMILNERNDLYEFYRDVPFKSSSAASGVISGASTSGPLCFGLRSTTR